MLINQDEDGQRPNVRKGFVVNPLAPPSVDSKQIIPALDLRKTELPQVDRRRLAAPGHLSFAFLEMAPNLKAVETAYKKTGRTFKSRNDLLTAIKEDWAKAIESLEPSEESNPENSTIRVKVNDTNYTIVGSVHSFSSGSTYRNMFAEFLRPQKILVHEQGMRIFFKYPDHAVAMADHAAITKKELLASGTIEVMRNFFSTIKEHLLWWKQAKLDMRELQLPASVTYTTDGLPMQLYLDVKVRSGLELDMIERRSGYQAEFMRYYKQGKDKTGHVGGLHLHQIRYFLDNPIKDREVLALAKYHAHLAEHHPWKYQFEYWNTHLRALGIAGAPIVAATLATAYGLNRLMNYVIESSFK